MTILPSPGPDSNTSPPREGLDLRTRLLMLLEQWDQQHAYGCCTRNCVYPDGRHGDPTDPILIEELVGIFGDNPPEVREHRTLPCPGTCTCQVGPYIRDLREAMR